MQQDHTQTTPETRPTLASAKAMARRLRLQHDAQGQPMTQAQALETVAHALGFRDWNSCHAALTRANRPAYEIGQQVSGSYLGQPFDARILALREMGQGWYRLTLDFDTAVDVVKFDSFSSLRKRVSGTIGPRGHSQEHTSDGHPHLMIDL